MLLKLIRLQRGLSQMQLCLLTGIHPSTLSRIENGQMYPYPGWRKRIAEALNMREEEIFPEVQADEARAEVQP